MSDPDAAAQQRQERRDPETDSTLLLMWCHRARSQRSGLPLSCLCDNSSEKGDADAAPEQIWTLRSALNQGVLYTGTRACVVTGQKAALREVKAALITFSPPFQLTQHPAAGI